MNTPILEGRIALVTGGSKGIGFGSAQQLIEEGAFVYITGRSKEALNAAVVRLGSSAAGIEADASSKADINAVAEQIRQRHGKLDILFANAGLGHATPFPDLTEAQIDKEIAVNFKGVILTVQSMLGMLSEGAAVILNASITADTGLPGFGVYAATKAAVRSLARSLTTDLKDRDIRVAKDALVHTDEYAIYARLPTWGYRHKTVCDGRGEYARDEDGDGFCEVHVNTMEGFWSLLRSWLRPHRGISQDKLPLYLGFFQFVYNARRRGKALLGTLIAGLVA